LVPKYYAKFVNENNLEVYKLVNLDMIGYPQPTGIVIIERDNNPDRRHNEVAENDEASEEFGEVMREMSYYTSPVSIKFNL
jgi:hypothetical protein